MSQSNRAARVACRNGIGRHILRHHRCRSDHGAHADPNTGLDHRPLTDPDISADDRSEENVLEEPILYEEPRQWLSIVIKHRARADHESRMRAKTNRHAARDGTERPDLRIANA